MTASNPLPSGLFWGSVYPFQAIALISRSPQFWGYIVIPILVNIVAGILLYTGLLIPTLQGVDALILKLPTWATWLGLILRILLAGGLFLAIGFLLTQFGVILGAPWYGKLAEKIEHHRTGQLPPAEAQGLGSIAYDLGRALLFELKKILLILGVGGLLLTLGFLPILGPLAVTLGSLGLSVTIVCLDFFDASLERRRLSFRTKLGLIRQALPASAGFGLVCLGLVSLPLLNLFTIPLCVVGGTLFFCDRIRPHLPG
ncbi:hypothetical protein BST81_16475 [Leptolyngbya sp. 'hensonii']|uniref:EI24 domain-containing protein n=1 Tax=Leptolyngbya sp. 'hensonii' TaxID=1922337 RepID=UPI00094F6F7A|nr:EI24 domain-containing protein [Leptolyngbya sp. 'hensonii']OLP17392.1 hypothetical protein BST81_16475 [Leptolyngbya sp. 'hensonii']